MKCYECRLEGCEREAVVLCHHCAAGLCEGHLLCVDDPVIVNEPLVKAVSLPLRARRFYCGSCGAAVQQRAEASARGI